MCIRDRDSDGQMSMMTNEKNMIEHQITGQMTIEEVLSEWEKMRKATAVIFFKFKYFINSPSFYCTQCIYAIP